MSSVADHGDRRLLLLALAFGFTFGFYIALLIVAIVLGDHGFTAAFPNPWRMLSCLPMVLLAVIAWRAVWR